MMAHQRSMAALQRAIGPEFDYSHLWDKHCEYEFGTRDVPPPWPPWWPSPM